jgi:hypothetical protein
MVLVNNCDSDDVENLQATSYLEKVNGRGI